MNDEASSQDNPFNWSIPQSEDGDGPLTIAITSSDRVFLLGPNGSGKSALVQHLVKANAQNPIVRIAAHRQTWFTSNSVDLTPKSRRDINRNIAQRDRQDDSRWKDDYAPARLSAALFDLAAAESKLNRTIADYVRNGDENRAKIWASNSSPLAQLNDLLQLGTLTAKIDINEDGDFVACHNEEQPRFSVAQLSDGERNAVLLAAQVLTVKPGTLLLIDEPERHLHRAITEPLLNALFATRPDCPFVVATHEVALPACTPDARVLLVRQCQWQGNIASSWTIDLLEPSTDIPGDIKRAILGARRRILFVEGTPDSLDLPLYSAILPDVTIAPRGGCRDVIRAVEGLRAANNLHWVEAYGLVDLDDRSANDVKQLKKRGVFALNVHSVEALFYSREARQQIAQRQAETFGGTTDDLLAAAETAALNTLSEEAVQKTLAARRCERNVRNAVLGQVPHWKVLRDGDGQEVQITVPSPIAKEIDIISKLVGASDIDALVSRYPLRQTAAFSEFAKALKLRSRKDYEHAVLVQAQRDDGFRNQLQKLIGPLVAAFDLKPVH